MHHTLKASRPSHTVSNHRSASSSVCRCLAYAVKKVTALPSPVVQSSGPLFHTFGFRCIYFCKPTPCFNSFLCVDLTGVLHVLAFPIYIHSCTRLQLLSVAMVLAKDIERSADGRLEEGFLSTAEEEKASLIAPPGHGQHHTPDPLDSRTPSSTMSPVKRLVIFCLVCCLVSFGLTSAVAPSVGTTCLGWARGQHNVRTNAVRSFLARRQNDAGAGSNVTTPGEVRDAPPTGAAAGQGQEQSGSSTSVSGADASKQEQCKCRHVSIERVYGNI